MADGDILVVTSRSDTALTLTWKLNAGASSLATSAEFITGTLTTKPPTVKQVRDFGAAASSIATKWNGADNLVTTGLATLAPYSDASGGATTYYDSTNDRWQLMRPSVSPGTGAKCGNLIFENVFFDFTKMVMSFELSTNLVANTIGHSFTDMYWGAESDALANSGDIWVGTNTKGMICRYKRNSGGSQGNRISMYVGCADSTIRTALGTGYFDGFYYKNTSTAGLMEFYNGAAADGSSNTAFMAPLSVGDTDRVNITFSVLNQHLSLYLNGTLYLVLDMGFVPGVGNTYTLGPRFGIMGDDGGAVPSSHYSYLHSLILGTPDPLNASPFIRPPTISINPSGTASSTATKVYWKDALYKFGAAWTDVTGRPSDTDIGSKAALNPPTNLTSSQKAAFRQAFNIETSGRLGDTYMDTIGDFDYVEEGEWVRYNAGLAGAPTANAGIMGVQGGDAISIDTTTGKLYTAVVSTGYGAWSTASAATLTNTNYSSASADTVVSIGSTNTGWPAAATAAGTGHAIGAKTVIGSTTWGICLVRSGVTCDAYSKNGTSAWALAGGLDAIVVSHWSNVPVGKIRLVDLWAKQIGKRLTITEQQWFYAVTDEGFFSGNALTQTRSSSQIENWRAAANPDVRGAPPGGNYTAVATASAVDSAGDIHYDTTTLTIKVYPKAGDETYWDGALRKGARFWMKNTALTDYIYGVVQTGVTWSSGVGTARLSTQDLIHSTALVSGNSMMPTAMGLYLTWDDYSNAALPLTPNTFDVWIGDVNRYEIGTSDAPSVSKRGLVWRVGENHLVVYDEDNVQHTNQRVPVTTFGNWGTATAPGAVTSLDATATPGLYRATSTTTGTRPEGNTSDFYFLVVGDGLWKYQLAWVKLVTDTNYGSYFASTSIALTNKGRVYISGSGTSRTIDINPNTGHSDLPTKLATGNSLVIVHTTTPTDTLRGNISAVADHPSISGAKRVTLINVSVTGEITVGDALRITTREDAGLKFRARQNVAQGNGYTFSGVNWAYSVVDLRLYFGISDMSAESSVTSGYGGFESTVTNEPSAVAGQAGLTWYDKTTGTQQAAFIQNSTYAAQSPTFNYFTRTFTTAQTFLQANWHNVPGLDTTSVGYDVVLSRKLVSGRHPAAGEVTLDTSTGKSVINVAEVVGSTQTASEGMSRLVVGTIIQYEQPANGRRWTGKITKITRQGALGIIEMAVLEERGSSGFFLNSEIKLFAQGYGMGELPTLGNLDSVTDALMGQWVQFRTAAGGNPFGEDGVLWISSEHNGEFYRKYQRAYSNQSLQSAQRLETLTAGAWSTAVSAPSDVHDAPATYNLNSPNLDAVTHFSATATNKPTGWTTGGLDRTWIRDDGTWAQIAISQNAIAWRTGTASAKTTLGTWTIGQPASTVMERIPNQANGFLDPRPVDEWRWFVESASLTGAPSLPDSAHYGFVRIEQGDSDKAFLNRVVYFQTSNNEVASVSQTVTEGWGNWVYAYEKPFVEQASNQGYYAGNAEISADSITFTPHPHTKYLVQAEIEIYFKIYEEDDQQIKSRIRENSGSNTGVNGTQRSIIINTLPIQSASYQNISEKLTYSFTTGASVASTTFHATVHPGFGAAQSGDNRPYIRHSELRIEMIK